MQVLWGLALMEQINEGSIGLFICIIAWNGGGASVTWSSFDGFPLTGWMRPRCPLCAAELYEMMKMWMRSPTEDWHCRAQMNPLVPVLDQATDHTHKKGWECRTMHQNHLTWMLMGWVGAHLSFQLTFSFQDRNNHLRGTVANGKGQQLRPERGREMSLMRNRWTHLIQQETWRI